MPKPQNVPGNVKTAISRGPRLREPQLAELAGHFFRVAGGPRQVAQMLYDEFMHGRPGSLVRQRILDMVLRAVKEGARLSPPPPELGILSEEDLLRELSLAAGDVPLSTLAGELARCEEEEEDEGADPRQEGGPGPAAGADPDRPAETEPGDAG